MRLVILGSLAMILLTAVPASACGGGGGDEPAGEEYRYCNDYTIHVGDESLGAHANEHGQFYLAVPIPLFETWYFEQDARYTDPENEWLLSLWWYMESNGRPGAQRADQVCNNTPEGEDSDTIPC